MKRIMIIGCGGAGKSTLARQLHEKTGLPLIHLDKHYWLPNWVESDKKAWKQKVQQFAHEEDWIIDGNYGGTMDIRLERATTVIFLDRSRWLCLYRVMMRLLKNKGQTRMDMGAGCKERFNWEFMSYVFHYNETRRP
ncbi:MAG: adenylate kinase, partial [Bacteroidota bacterium]